MKRQKFQGVGIFKGIAVGPAFLYKRNQLILKEVSTIDVNLERERLQKALNVAYKQIEEIKQNLLENADMNTARIFEFHLLMLQDKELLKGIESKISTGNYTVEKALSEVFDDWIGRFEKMSSQMMQTRAGDLKDVKNRLLSILSGQEKISLNLPSHPVILIADDLTPSETALLDKSKILGIATSFGGPTSHSAIIAKMLGIPSVVGLGEGIFSIINSEILALDGEKGELEVGLTQELINDYQVLQRIAILNNEEAKKKALDPAITLDGKRVEVVANISDEESAREALISGAEGVGLLRTEFLYLGKSSLPDEEEQFRVYSDIAKLMENRPLIIRTLDVGGDKHLPYLNLETELNPFLGLRGIRLCLNKTEVFIPQLRAILRANAKFNNIKILLPMISTLEELQQVKGILERVRDDLNISGVDNLGKIEIGVMIETPASVVIADILAAEVDFFSIGTNDLIQYTLAVDRGNEKLNYLYNSLDPSVLRLIHQVIKVGHQAGKWVGVCGEMAGEFLSLPVLLGMGLDEFSMSPSLIPTNKELIRKLSYEQTKKLSQEVLLLKTKEEIKSRIEYFLNNVGINILSDHNYISN